MPTRPSKSLPVAASVLIGCCSATVAVAFVVRMLAIAEPLGIDQSLWASAVRGMARGQRLYRDVWEQRPPGIYFTYLAGFSIFGWTPAAVAWLDVIASGVTTAILYGLARSIDTRVTAALAAAMFALLTMPAWLYSYGGFLERAVCETFIVSCVGGGAWCAIVIRRSGSPIAACGFGLLAGGAVLYKPNAALYFPGFLLWALASRPRRSWIPSGMLVAAAAAVLPLLTLSWLWHFGLLGDARTAVIDFNRWYVALGFEPRAYALALSHAIWLRVKTDPLWLAGGIGSVVAVWTIVLHRRLPDLPAVATLWGGGALLMILVNGNRLFNSYFSQAFAPLALMAAWWLSVDESGMRWRRVARATTAVLMLYLLWSRGFVPRVRDAALADAAVLTGRMDRVTYLDRFGGYGNDRGYSARANDELAAYVREHSAPDERIYLFGINGAGVYFLADRLTAHRFLRVNFFVPDDFPDPTFTLTAVVRDLEARLPSYLVFETLHSPSAMGRAVDALPENPAVRHLLAGYVRETRIEDFTVYRRSSSAQVGPATAGPYDKPYALR